MQINQQDLQNQFPLYRKSAFVKGIQYKIINHNTVIANNHGHLSTNHFAQYTINELLANEYNDYAVSSEREWEAELPTTETDRGIRIAGGTIHYPNGNPVLQGIMDSDREDDLHTVIAELNRENG